MSTSPILSICIPAYNRPNWLRRALESIMLTNSDIQEAIEIIVTDDSSDSKCGEVAQEILKAWKGEWFYSFNNPRLGMAQNWNRSIKLASGEYVLILHDDDFLLKDALADIVRAIAQAEKQHLVLLFGVVVVNETEQIIKQQNFRKPIYLPPKQALIKLLSNSSFVRFPAIVIQRHLFTEVGYFNPEWGEPTDIEMWIRLFSRYGVLCLPFATCAYTVHSQALTMGMFKEQTIDTLLKLFVEVDKLKILNQEESEQCQSLFIHQFILAGAYRQLKRKQWSKFQKTMKLFELEKIRHLTIPTKWLLIRASFSLISRFTAI